MNKFLFGAGLMAALVAPVGANAATATGKMNVRIAIQASCEVVSTSDLDFGNVNSTTSIIDQASSVTVKCSNSTVYDVGLSVGSGGGSVASRRMAGPGGAFVNYALYRDAARTQVWGDTVKTDTVSSTGTGANQVFPVYGRVLSQTTPAPGSYSDVVTVTITY